LTFIHIFAICLLPGWANNTTCFSSYNSRIEGKPL